MIVLGVETSCDDSGVGIVVDGDAILANVTASQHLFHERFGGIVPTVAARQHCRAINPLIEMALEQAGLGMADLDAIAVTSDQGLGPCLGVGVSAAKALAFGLSVPLVGVHHVEGHIYSCLMGGNSRLEFPFLCLTVAGGHTMLLAAHSLGVYELVGGSRDDAAGEAYDKIARRLGLGYPGGPIIDRLSESGDPSAFRFPRPMSGAATFDFSFSGLKTAVNRTIDELEESGVPFAVADVAASFQQAVVDLLVAKTRRAAAELGFRRVAVAGGVAANSSLQGQLQAACAEDDLELYSVAREMCVDNGAMIAGIGYHLIQSGRRADMALDYRPNSPLGELGVKYRPLTKYQRN